MDKELLKELKAEPPFGEIRFDRLIFDALRRSASSASSASERPTLIVLCGPSGCGKSTIKEKLLADERITDYIDIDPDEIRTILMKNGVRFSDNKTMAGITNAFNKRMSDRAQEMRLNIVFDTTGQNRNAVRDIIKSSKQIRYKTTFAVIWASKETCLRRVERRNASSLDRLVLPIDIAEGIYDGFLEKGTASNYLVEPYNVRVDNVFLYNNDTDGANAVVLFSKEGTKVTPTDFSGFYNMDLTVAPPFITITEKGEKGGKRKTKRVSYRKNKRSKTKRRRNKKSKRHFK
jgi:predicted kinase